MDQQDRYDEEQPEVNLGDSHMAAEMAQPNSE